MARKKDITGRERLNGLSKGQAEKNGKGSVQLRTTPYGHYPIKFNCDRDGVPINKAALDQLGINYKDHI